MNESDSEKYGSITMGEIFSRIEDGDREALAILKRIESNTRKQIATKSTDNADTKTAANTVFKIAETVNVAAEKIGKALPLSPLSPTMAVAIGHTVKPQKERVPTLNSTGDNVKFAIGKTERDSKGRFTSASATPSPVPGDQAKTLAEILKGGVQKTWSEKKGNVKDIAGRAALGPMWDIGKEVKEEFASAKDKSDQGTTGELKQWGKDKFGKQGADVKFAIGTQNFNKKLKKSIDDLNKSTNESVKQGKQSLKARMRDQGGNRLAAAPQSNNVINNNGGGLMDTVAGAAGGHLLKKVAGKVPFLGKLFPSLAGTAGTAAKAAGTVATEAGGAVAGGAAKAAGGGMLKAVGGRIPLIGGLISGGLTLAAGGSKTEAAGSAAGAIGGAALGTVVAGPIGTVVGGIAGEWIGKKLGGLFNKQNKDQDDLLNRQASQQEGFFSQLASGWDKTKNAVQDKVSGAEQAWEESRSNGGGLWTSGIAAAKGFVKGASGVTKERYQAQRANIAEAAKATGMDQDVLTQIAGVESNFKPDAKAGTSSAGGLYQFTDATWQAQLAKNGAKHGLSAGTSKFDPRANALLGAEFTKENGQKLNSAGFGADSSNLYMAHFLGAGSKKSGVGAIGFLNKMQQNPDAAPALDPKFASAAAANKSIFYDNSGRAKSYQEIYSGFQKKMSKYSMASLGDGTTPPNLPLSGSTVYEAQKAKFIADQQAPPTTVAKKKEKPTAIAQKTTVGSTQKEQQVASPVEQAAQAIPLDQPAQIQSVPSTPEAQARQLGDTVASIKKDNSSRIADSRAKKAADDAKSQAISDREQAAYAVLDAKGSAATDEEYNKVRDSAQAERVAARSEPTPATAEAKQATSREAQQVAAKSSPAIAEGQSQYKRPPEPKPIQPEPPKIQGMEQLVAATQQQNQTPPDKPDGGKGDSRAASIPNITTEFSDTQLILMAYDRV